MFLTFKCKLCNEIYEDPVTLPCCNKSICIKHVELINKTKYNCELCNDYIQLPLYGFRYDNRAIKHTILTVFIIIIQVCSIINLNINLTQIDDIFFTPNNCMAKQACRNLSDIIKQSDRLAQNPHVYIENYFNKLKTELNTKKEEYIQTIERNYLKNLNEIEILEIECLKTNILLKANLFGNSIKTSKLKLEEWNNNLNVPDVSNDLYWKRVILRANQETSKLKYLTKNLENELLLNKEFQFVSKPIIDDNNFGHIEIMDKTKQVITDSKPEGTFQLVINDFSEFKAKKDYCESIDSIMIKNVPWRIQTQIEETQDFDLGLGFYIRPDLESIFFSPINAKIKLKLLTNSGLIFEKNFIYKFEDNSGRGYSPFVLLRDLMNPINGILNNNSITLEAHIKVL